MTLNKRFQTIRNKSEYAARRIVPFLLTLILLSCDSLSGPNYIRDRELRLQVKPVLLIENETITATDVVTIINKSTIRRGGYVAILPTSSGDKAAGKLRNFFYNKHIEAVHIIKLEPQATIKNTDVLTIENATVLCLLDGDINNFVHSAGYSELKSAILNAYKKGALLVLYGQAGSLAQDSYFKFDEVITSRLSE